MKVCENLDLQYLDKLDDISFQPVFILGLHRSGTSILYKMITETSDMNAVTAYHIIKYNELLYNHIHGKEKIVKDKLIDFLQKQGQIDRGIDKLKIDADFAEEYGFLLGKVSNKMYITKSNVSVFINMAKKILFISNSNKPILFKNPYDLSNFLYIKKVFPNAKFIFIHRNPYNVISSFVKAIQHLFRIKNPYTSLLYKDYNRLYDNPLSLFFIRLLYLKLTLFGTIYITLVCSKALRYYMKNIKKLSKKDYIVVSYENLCEKPSETMKDIFVFLEIKPDRLDFTSYIRQRGDNLDLNVLKLKYFIYKNMKRYFDFFNYDKNL